MFFQLCKFFSNFMKNYFKITSLLTQITCKDKFKQIIPIEQGLDILKTLVIIVSILIYFDFWNAFFDKSDVFEFVFQAVISQYDEDKHFHTIVLHLKQFQVAKINFKIQNKKLLAIESWYFLERAQHSIKFYTVHKILEYFMFAKVLKKWQKCWNTLLSRFNFIIKYCLCL